MSERTYYSREAEQQAQREKLGLVILASLLGFGFGSIIAFLFAPQAGDKTRHQLEEQVGHVVADGRKTANRVASDLRENTEEWRENVEKRLKAVGE